MLDINLVRDNPDLVKEGFKNRGGDPILVDELVKADTAWRQLTGKIEELRAKE